MKKENNKQFWRNPILTFFTGLLFGIMTLTLILSHIPTNTRAFQPLVPSFLKENEGINVSYRVYSPRESRAFLNRDLLSKGVQPIQVSIQNNSNSSYIIKADQINLETTTPNSVAWKYSLDALPRKIAYKIATIFFFPFVIPDTIDSIVSAMRHQEIKKSLEAKVIKDEEEIVLPYSSLSRVVLVSNENFGGNFSIDLIDEKGNVETFSTPIAKSKEAPADY